MSARKLGAPTTFDELAERQRRTNEADVERQWNEWTDRRKRDEAADVKRAQREMLRQLDLPLDALDILTRGSESATPAMQAISLPADILVLSGSVGTGKTVAAVAWLHAWVSDRRNWQVGEAGATPIGRCMFATAPGLQRGPRFDKKWFEGLARVNRLVVDDLGSEYDKEGAFASFIEELVNERYARHRPTLITTNCDATVFKARYGARIADRIRERGRFESVGSKSMRGKK